jgi:hypothetical protein
MKEQFPEFKNKRRVDRVIYRARYESMIAFDMRKIFRLIGEEFALQYGQNRGLPSIQHYKADIASHLKMNYVKIAKIYKTNFREMVTSKALSDEELNNRIDAQIIRNINTRSRGQSDIIMVTLEENINTDLRQVMIEASSQGIRLDKQGIADATKKKFVEQSIARSNTIGTTEFTGMSNDTIFAEGSVINDSTNKKLIKHWSATLDMVTRPAHIFADGQEVDMYECFTVGEEQLLFPGDGSNGASAGNLCNCRCELEMIG